MRGNHRGIIFLASERAASLRLDHANLLRGQIKDAQQRLVYVVRTLHRTPDGEAIGLRPIRDDTVVLNVELLLRAGMVFACDNVRCSLPRGIHVALFHQEALDDVVLAPHNRLLPLALLDGKNGRKRFVVNLHRGHGFVQPRLVRVRQQHYRFFGMIHLRFDEHRLVVIHDQRNAIFPRNVLRGDDHELVPRDAGAEANVLDNAACNVAAHCGSMPHTGQCHVVDITRAPRHLADSFLAKGRRADNVGLCRVAHHWKASLACPDGFGVLR